MGESVDYDVDMLKRQVIAWAKDIEGHRAAIEELRKRIQHYERLIQEGDSDGGKN